MSGYIGNAPSAVPLTSADITDNIIVNADINTNAGITTEKLSLISTASVASVTAKGTPSVSDGYIQLNCEQNSHGIKIKSPPHSAGANYTLVMPSATGTSLQVLRMNSGATALEFASASSDFVKLADTTASNVASVDLNGYFTSDYDVYKIFLEGWYTHQSSNNRIGFRYNTGSYTTQTSNYYAVFDSASYNSSGAGGESGRGLWNSSRADFGFSSSDGNSTAQRRANIELTLYNPRTTSYYKHSLSSCGAYADGSDYMYKMDGFQVWYDLTAVTGIRFFVPDGGNVTVNKIRLYGIKN